MANYHYIIAGLPDLTLDFESSGFNFDSFLNQITSMCSKEDIRRIEWLLFGFREENLNNHFYREAKKSPVKFIREYFSFDLEMRNIQAAYVSRKIAQDPSEFIIGEGEIAESLKMSKANDFGISMLSDTASAVLKVLENTDILQREQLLDSLRWEKANEICKFNYFDIDVILSFIFKASVVARWIKLDKKTGEEVFRKFVEEVKGSYKKENNN